MKTIGLLSCILMLASATLNAQIISTPLPYQQGETVLDGWLVHDSAVEGARPGVIVFHQWGGPGEYEKSRAHMLAELGYVVLVADVYGQGVRPTEVADKNATATIYRNDRVLARARAQAALDTLKAQPQVDATKVAAIGYCFGGMVALELARSGAPVAAVASIHGSLNTPDPADAGKIAGAVLVQHGADDPYVPAAEVASFREAMDAADANYRFIAYEGAVHSFTDWYAGDDASSGAAYNKEADKQSWADLKEFLAEQLK
jgi:dienelactone hydrolase